MIVLPSSLVSPRDEKATDAQHRAFNNSSLRQGIVLSVYEISDEANITKTGPEYDVMCIEQDGQFGINTTIYKNCLTIDGFGGVADFFQAKYRPVKDPMKTKSKGSFKDETGSVVLIMCLDGISEKAIILKSLANPSKKILTKDKGLHLEGEYNGVNYQVNKDGELTVTFRSATNDDGTVKDKNTSGTFIKIDKTGSIELNDNNKESIRIDKKNKTIHSKAEKDISNTTEANFNVNTKESINLKAQKDLIATLEGKFTFNAQEPSSIDVKGELKVTAPSVIVEAQDMVRILANQVHVFSNQTLLGNGAVPAVVPITMYIGVGNLSSPVISFSVGPYSSSVSIAL